MLEFLKQIFISARTFFSCNVLNANSLKQVSMSNQECRVSSEIININNNKPLFYRYSILANKCSGSYNNITDPYAKLCVVKNLNFQVFNLMSRPNKTRHIGWYETCRCKSSLNASVCNDKKTLK